MDDKTKIDSAVRVVLIGAYTISLLLFSYLLVSVLLKQAPSGECYGINCLNVAFAEASRTFFILISSIGLVLQLPTYLAIIFKKQWLTDKKYFKSIALLMLIVPYILPLLLLFVLAL